MSTFLSSAAKTVFNHCKLKDLRNIAVILPSRRSSFFFKSELAQLSEIPFISPEVFAIDDFVCNLSGLQISDQVSLFFDLFQEYQKVDESIKFEEFVSWAPTVLKDFDLIDQYLVEDVKALFNYMSEIEALKRWEPDSSKPIENTDHTASYFKLYENLSTVYFEFRKTLINQNRAYRGMAYRLLAEDLEQIVLDDLSYTHFYFIGLNALSKSEEKIISTLVKAKNATCIWDTDVWFMNSNHQAGDILRKYKKTHLFGEWNTSENLLLSSEKEISIYESPFDSLQSKIGSKLLSTGNTVFVVPDENLIQPLLFSLGKEVDDYNITMGLGMGQSKLTALVNLLFELHGQGFYQNKSGIRYSHTFVQKILTDPLIKKYESRVYAQKQPFSFLKQSIIDKNKVFIEERELTEYIKDEPLLSAIFTHWDGNSKNAIKSLKQVTNTIREQIFDELDSIEKEFFMLFFSVLNRLEDEQDLHKDLSIIAIKLLLKELSKLERVPFTGEPIASLQIMSLLETRCLDFDNVVLFSFNEGVIPSSNKNNSLIPFEACKEFGIPVFSDQDSIMAYHFYRLMMRAKKVDIIYTNAKSTGIGGSKDASRFVLQLVNGLAKENPKIKINKTPVDFERNSDPSPSVEISIQKNEEILNQVSKYIEHKGLSASSISQYYRCSLQFYFSKILGLKEADEVEETFGADMFGNWIHQSIEKISKDVIGLNKTVNNGILPSVNREIPKVLDHVFKEYFEGYQIDRGINFIYKKMAQKLIEEYYQKCFFDSDDRKIISVEEKYSVEINLANVKLKLNGLIDSIEMVGNVLYLIDFKTGKVSDLNIGQKSTFEESFKKPTNDKFRQLVIYKYLILKHIIKVGEINGNSFNTNSEIISGMYSFRDLSQFFIQETMDYNVIIEKTEMALTELTADLFNSELPFNQTSDIKNCEYCSFNTICNKT
jgi:CRISPR/Cas system-associated exonuclease Cas4 (RecB family)